MTIAPLLPLSGYAGWRYLQRTLLEQQARVAASTTTQREETYFREKIGGVTSAADLVADRRLLQVALSAFGLEEQIDSKALIRQVLEGGTTDSDALANRLNNKAYAALAEAFAFDGETSAIAEEGFADRILRSYETQTFQNAVTEQNETLGLALNAQQEIAALAETGSSDATKWYSILASSSLREVFETAFGLPDTFGAIDIDRQVTMLRRKAEQHFGSSEVAQFTDPEALERLVRQYVIRASAEEVAASSPALTILQGRSSSSSLLEILLG